MDEAQQDEVIRHLDTIMEWAQGGVDFAAAQAPAVATEIVRWGIVDGLLGATVFGVLAFGVWRYGHRAILLQRGENPSPIAREDAAIATTILGIIVAVIATGSVFCFSRALKAMVAPKLYVLEKITGMLS